MLTIAFVSGAVVALLLSVFWLVQLRQELNQTRAALKELQAEYQAGEGEERPMTKVAPLLHPGRTGRKLPGLGSKGDPPTSAPELAAIEELIKGPSAQGLQPRTSPRPR